MGEDVECTVWDYCCLFVVCLIKALLMYETRPPICSTRKLFLFNLLTWTSNANKLNCQCELSLCHKICFNFFTIIKYSDIILIFLPRRHFKPLIKPHNSSSDPQKIVVPQIMWQKSKISQTKALQIGVLLILISLHCSTLHRLQRHLLKLQWHFCSKSLLISDSG